MITVPTVRGSRIELKSAPKTERQMKNLRFEVKDAEKGLVSCVFATFNVKDYDGDWTLPDAFENAAAVAISAYGHRSWAGAMPVGKGILRVEKDRAILDGQFFLNTEAGKETFAVVKEMGELQEWSYGFDVLETGELTQDLRQKGVWRVIQKAKVYEVSPVLVGAGVDTQTLTVKAKKDEQETEDRKAADAMATEARQQLARFLKTRARLAS
jgi:HK97 family phage prohead protease